MPCCSTYLSLWMVLHHKDLWLILPSILQGFSWHTPLSDSHFAKNTISWRKKHQKQIRHTLDTAEVVSRWDWIPRNVRFLFQALAVALNRSSLPGMLVPSKGSMIRRWNVARNFCTGLGTPARRRGPLDEKIGISATNIGITRWFIDIYVYWESWLNIETTRLRNGFRVDTCIYICRYILYIYIHSVYI
jgi:hypothetical protein